MFEYKAKVKRIIDGDTLDLQVDLGFNVKLDIRGRLLGVNTPERGDENWTTATQQFHKLLESVSKSENGELELTIKTHKDKKEKYGRWLVEIDGVNSELAKIWPYLD